jgi:hypothetical protein
VELSETKRDESSTVGHRDHEQIVEETARGMWIWRMLMVEECRLRLFDNSVSGRRGGLIGRRRGGVVAPMTTSGSIALIAIDCPAAAIGAVVRRNLNMTNPRMMPADAQVELRVSLSPPQAMGSTRRRKGAKTKPPLKCVTCYSIVATAW